MDGLASPQDAPVEAEGEEVELKMRDIQAWFF